MTKETKSIIDNIFTEVFDRIEKSVSIGIAEDMSPNDIEYNSTLDSEWEIAMEYLAKKLINYTEKL